MKIFKQYSVKRIFFSSFFLLMIVVFIVVIVVSYHFSVREIVKQTTLHQERNLELISEDISGNLKSLYDYSIVLSRQQAFRDTFKSFNNSFERLNIFETLTKDYSNTIYSVPVLHSIEIYLEDPPVDNLYYPVRYHELQNVTNQPWYSSLEKIRSTWLGKRTVNTIAGEQEVISQGLKISSARGNLQAVLIINVDPVIIEGWLRSYGEQANLVLLSRQNEIITKFGQNDFEQGFSDVQLGKYREEITENQYKKLEIYHNEKEYVVVSSLIDQADWLLMEITPLNNLTNGLKQMIGYLILIGICSILIAFLGTLYLTRRFTEPVMMLTKVMSADDISESKKDLPNDYKNEFGQLFAGYRKLIERSENLYRSLVKQLKRQREAEMKALQANINPHFLYNTLDQLNWMAIDRDYYDMSEMLELLGKMLREGLSKGESIFTLEQELSYLDYYLQLQKIRHGNHLAYKIDIPKNLLYYYIPKLTFQPFVENAIIHGLHEQSQGEVWVKVEEREDHLLCKIIDNGTGLTSSISKSKKMDTGGYGIQNVKERLDIYFGSKANVVVEDRPEGGVISCITIPKVTDKDSMEQITLESFDVKE